LKVLGVESKRYGGRGKCFNGVCQTKLEAGPEPEFRHIKETPGWGGLFGKNTQKREHWTKEVGGKKTQSSSF